MYFLNAHDIDDMLATIARRAPSALPYARFLADWRDIVDNNSDGWAHWSRAPKAARALMVALVDARQSGRPDLPALRKACGPIKACATRYKLPTPVLRA